MNPKRYLFIVGCILVQLIALGQDTIPPYFITFPQSKSLECNTPSIPDSITVWYNRHAGAVASDDSGQASILASSPLSEILQHFSNSSTPQCDSVMIWFTPVDAAGNTGEADTVYISVVDQLPPVISGGKNVQYACVEGIRDSLIQWIQQKGGYIATESCSDTVIWTTYQYLMVSGADTLASGLGNIATGPYPSIPDSICQWVVYVAFQLDFPCGPDPSSPARTFAVTDTIPPILNGVPRDTLVSCSDRNPIPPVSATDYCDRSVRVTLAVTDTRSLDFRTCGHFNYTIQRTWTATDACGNSTSQTQTLSIRDTIPPTFTGPADVTVGCQTFYKAPDSLFVRITDDCSNSVHIKKLYSDSLISTGCASVIRRTYTATDLCGNSRSFTQRLHIVQNEPPVVIKPAENRHFHCEETRDLDAELAVWVAGGGGAVVSSTCSQTQFFAAVKGSYTLGDTTTWPGVRPATVPQAGCPSALSGYLRFLEVDFVFFDTCGNATVTSAIFGVTDTVAPRVLNCPAPITLYTPGEFCDVRLPFIIPGAEDNCSEPSRLIRRQAVARITSPQPAGFSTVVDTAFLRLGPVNPNTTDAALDGTLAVTLRSMDIDGTFEYFSVYSESGGFIANTPTGTSECGTTQFTIPMPKDSLKQWVKDGFITFVFAPHTEKLDSIFFINNICGGSQIEAELSFETTQDNIIRRSLLVDGILTNPLITSDTVWVNLRKGSHTLTARFADCANTTADCIVPVTVIDTIAPIIQCPPAMTVSLAEGKCSDTVSIQTNWVLRENCDGSRRFDGMAPSTSDAAKIAFAFRESTALFEALSSQLVFRNTFPVRYIQSDIRLDVTFQGDNGGPEKTFELIGPGAYRIGRTKTGTPGQCGETVTTFFIPASVFNTWIINGEVTIIAIPEIGPEGIRPCGPLETGTNTDGSSFLQARLQYSDAVFRLSSVGATLFPPVDVPADKDNMSLILQAGTNLLTLTTTDGAGNTGSCRFQLDVADRERPVARCKNTLVETEPSGLTPAVVTPDMIDAGSTDNCRIDNRFVIPSQFDCSLAGTDVSALLVVEDDQGNRDTCTTTVKVKPFALKPTFSAGLCAKDTLKLFSNLPPSAIPGSYSYTWDGPGTLDFITENVFIPNVNESYNGVYVLTVKGFNDCISTGSVVVNVKPLTNPQLSTPDNEICENDEVVLSCTQYSGDIEYQWFQGTFPSGVLLKKTKNPELILTPGLLGANFYYVIARGPECSSNPSPLLRVNVLKIPVATVNDLFLSPCEGDNIALGSPVNNPNFTFHWSGPAGYEETGKNPKIIPNAQLENSGNYYLVIRNKECISDTAVTKVVIAERPAKPSIISADIFCEGATFTMVAAASPNAERYEWKKDNVLFTVTQDNSLIIPNAQAALQGVWTVIAVKGNCRSAASADKFVAIDNSLEVGAINSGPICDGDNVSLQATFVPNATYQWSGPAGALPSVFNPVVPGIAGEYTVTITTPTGCQNTAGTMVTVIPVPSITALSNDAKACMKPAEKIRFFPSIFPSGANYTYEWTGPGQFSSSQSNPILENLSPQDTGLYTLRVFFKGCPSEAISTRVAFELIPPVPVITAPPYVCEGDAIQLTVASTAERFVWQTPTGQTITQTPILTIPAGAFIHAGTYVVSAEQNGCTSDVSPSVSVQVRPRPATPVLETNSPVCFGDTLLISVRQPEAVQYRWTGPQAAGTPGNTIFIPSATSAASGIWSVTAEKNGCLSPAAPGITVVIKDEIKVPSFSADLIALCKDQSNGVELCFRPESLHPNALYSLVLTSTGETLSSGNMPCVVINDLTKLGVGTNFITATAGIDGCMSRVSSPVIITINVPPALKATVVNNEVIACPGESVQFISRDGPPQVLLKWSAADPSVRISNNTVSAPVFSGLSPGRNKVYLTYSIPGCPDFSKDTGEVYVEFLPEATDDTYSLPAETNSILPVMLNDIFPAGASITVVSQPKHGTISVSNNQLLYRPDGRYLQEQQCTYRICADYCEELCDEATVTLRLNEEILCRCPNIFTPNEDGINDAFVVPCLSTGQYPDNALMVFNEWGAEVFSARPYKNDWNGTYAGAPLPAGTYFFILEPGSGLATVTGFLVLQR